MRKLLKGLLPNLCMAQPQNNNNSAPNIPNQPLPPIKKPMGLGGHLSAPKGYTPKKINPAAMSQMSPVSEKDSQEQMAKEFERLKKKLDVLKKQLLKKYKFIQSIGIIPGQAAPLFEEEEQLPPEVTDTKPIHLAIIIPEDEYKNIAKIKPEVLKMIQDTKENLWLHVWTPVDVFNFGQDSRFDLLDAVSSSFPVHDDGFLGALRVTSIHKSLLLRRFDKYIATYVVAGSLIRGTADPESDIDAFVIIDDTDVKRMPRMELKEKLTGISYDYIKEAVALAGTKNSIHVQVYLLTEFWQNVKDAHPVMFTFIRDGIPLHDRGTFLPWKMLLKMGKIKPSPEAIDLFMRQGDQTEELVKRRMMDSMIDVYYGVVTPTQALMMLAGEAPPVPKTIAQEAKDLFVTREKWLTEKDLEVMVKAVKHFKDYEHGKLKEISGKEVDELVKGALIYNKKLKELRKKIEVYMQKKSTDELFGDLFKILKAILGNKSQSELIKSFNGELIKTGKIAPRFLKMLSGLSKAKSKIASGKIGTKEADSIKKDILEIMDVLTEFQQRKDLSETRKGTLVIGYANENKAELVLTKQGNFLIEQDKIRKLESHKLVDSNQEEFEKALAHGVEENPAIKTDLLKDLEKELGKIDLLL